jgi:hypothetical protein
MPMTESISIADQIAEVKRELALRKTVYPHLIYKGRLTQSQADQQMASMGAVLDTLLRLSGSDEDAPRLPL